MPERVKKMKCGGGCRGWRVKILGREYITYKKSGGGGSVEEYVVFRGVKY